MFLGFPSVAAFVDIFVTPLAGFNQCDICVDFLVFFNYTMLSYAVACYVLWYRAFLL